MRIYANPETKNTKAVKIQVFEEVPEYGIFEEGQIIYCKDSSKKGLYINANGVWNKALGDLPAWRMICQEFYVDVKDKQMFDLNVPYVMHTDSVLVFVNGRKLPRQAYVEITETQILLKDPIDVDTYVEFQYFKI